MSIYVGVNPDDLHRLRPVVNLFFQQAIGLQTRELPEHNPKLKFQVMMLLDEFAALGRMPIIAEAISYLPGYNVRVVLVVQTPSQLRELYGPHVAETMLKSLAVRIVFAAKDHADAREISDELGFQTVKAKSVSTPLFDFSAEKSRRSRSQTASLQRRALLLPQEVKDLGNEEAIIFYEGLKPIRCRKIRYYRDHRFVARLFPAPVVAAWAPDASVDAPPNEIAAAAEVGAEPIRRETTPVVREARVEDIERLDSIKLEDFATDFSRVEIPEKAEGERLTSAEMHTAVESFLDSLRER